MNNYLEYQREYQKARCARFKAEGRCVRCGKVDERTKGGRVHCAVCVDLHRNNYLKRYYRLKSENRCVVCGKQDKHTINGYLRCFSCAVKQAQSQEKSRKKQTETYEDRTI